MPATKDDEAKVNVRVVTLFVEGMVDDEEELENGTATLSFNGLGDDIFFLGVAVVGGTKSKTMSSDRIWTRKCPKNKSSKIPKINPYKDT